MSSLELRELLGDRDYKELLAHKLAQKAEKGAFFPTFSDWLPQVSPDFVWDWPHLVYLQDKLQKVIDGEIKKLMIFMPPRHGKTEMTTIRLPSYWLERNPHQRVILAAYNQTLANKFSRKVRKIALERISVNMESRAVDDWTTEPGGGLRAVGVGAGIAGVGGDLIVIDDPVKSREQAASKRFRDRAYDWYTDDIFTRLEPGGAIIIIQTRWHEDDLSGRILSLEDDWEVVSLPALAEANDPLGREIGDALCPERFSRDGLIEIRNVMGRGFSALYQQRPVEQEGGFFKRTWFQSAATLPPQSELQFVRFWDKAGTTDGDFTAGILMAYHKLSKTYYIADLVHGQWTPHERDKFILETAISDKALYGNVRIRHEQEPGSAGIDAARATNTLLQGFPVRAIRPTGSKSVRAEPFQAQVEAGNVFVLKGRWNAAFLDELTSFPNGKHDDIVDASSGAFNQVVRASSAFIKVGNSPQTPRQTP